MNAGAVPGDVMNQMLHAAADVAVKAQQKTAREMLKGPYRTGELADSVKKGRIRTSRDGKAISIEFGGTRKRGRKKLTESTNAEIAFVNEFGKRGQPPRPFIQTANERCEEEALEAAAKIYDKWLESKGF